MAKASLTANALIAKLKEQLADAKRAVQIWKERYEKLNSKKLRDNHVVDR